MRDPYKIDNLKKLKLALCKAKLVAPYVATAGLTFGVFSHYGLTPFLRDANSKKYLDIKETFDSLGNIKYEQTYDDFDSYDNVISIFNSWNINDDGLYQREVKTYSLKDIDEEAIRNSVNNNTFEELLGQPISVVLEKQNNVSKEELKNGAYIEATIYSKNENKYIIVKEPFSKNLKSTILWMDIVMLLGIIEGLAIKSKHGYDYKKYCEEVDIINDEKKVLVKEF